MCAVNRGMEVKVLREAVTVKRNLIPEVRMPARCAVQGTADPGCFDTATPMLCFALLFFVRPSDKLKGEFLLCPKTKKQLLPL